MNIHIRMITIVAAALLTVSACSSMQSARHEYLMRGQVVEVTGREAVVCVGTRDGAREGQELGAFKLVSMTTGAPARNPARWEKVRAGSIRLTDIIDEHFARAEIVSGEVQVNDIVELER
jgi:hypothetical protein